MFRDCNHNHEKVLLRHRFGLLLGKPVDSTPPLLMTLLRLPAWGVSLGKHQKLPGHKFGGLQQFSMSGVHFAMR